MKLFNTLTNKKEEFKPLKEGEVSIYVCGPTVYNYVHIGNTRPMIVFDVLRRTFEYQGNKVTFVSNFTDVDDKIIKAAKQEGISEKELTDKYIKAYEDVRRDLNLEFPTYAPRVTETMDQIIAFIEKLVEKGYAYEVEGDVYFRVSKVKEYGELSGIKIEDLVAGASERVEDKGVKEESTDFALWKKTDEGIQFDSPWSKGRPGWHTECVVMINDIFENGRIDIHGGGQDLIFPHHENEIAQSKCSCGGEFARYWMHNGYININGEKMSKSGTFMLLRQVLEQFEGRVIRLFVLGAHYRKPMEFSNYELNQAKSSLERIENALVRAKNILANEAVENGNDCVELAEVLKTSSEKFIAGMDDDFNTAQGLGAIFELVKELNKALDSEKLSVLGKENVQKTVDYIVNIMEEVLGVKLKLDNEVGNLTSELVEFILELRREARAEKNWGMSDKIRDRLAEMGIKIKDGKDKTTWSM